MLNGHCFSALKGQNISAQGNALGTEDVQTRKP